MFRKSVILASFAILLAAGSAFAATSYTGAVTRVDRVNGDIWLDNGKEYHVGNAFAAGFLIGDRVSVIYTDTQSPINVISASPARG